MLTISAIAAALSLGVSGTAVPRDCPPAAARQRAGGPTALSADVAHYARINGICIYYEVHGTGRPLLLLHGGTTSEEAFAGQLPALTRQFRVIVPDLRGHGRTSDAPGPIGYALLTRDVEALLDEVGVEDVAAIGWSMGGATALHLALRRPSRLRCMILTATPFHWSGLDPAFRTRLASMLPEEWSEEVRRFYETSAPDPRNRPAFFEKIRAMVLREPEFPTAELQAVRIPTLALFGDRDAVIRPSHMRELGSAIPGADVHVIPGGTHFVHRQREEQVNEELLRFLSTRCSEEDAARQGKGGGS